MQSVEKKGAKRRSSAKKRREKAKQREHATTISMLQSQAISIADRLAILREEASAPALVEPHPRPTKTKIVDHLTYERIMSYVLDYRGLAIDCELEMVKSHFLHVEHLTLKGILRALLGRRVLLQYDFFRDSAKKFQRKYEKMAKDRRNHNQLNKLAVQLAVSPVLLARLVLSAKYDADDQRVAELIRNPELIPDLKLAANVKKCVERDITDGPLAEMRQRTICFKFKMQFRNLADALGLYYWDEGDGTTPDVRLIIPIGCRDELVSWMMCITDFGDIDTHEDMLKRALPFHGRFGAGIVIYWVGFHADILRHPDNVPGILIMDDFPKREDVEILL